MVHVYLSVFILSLFIRYTDLCIALCLFWSFDSGEGVSLLIN